MLAAAIGRCGDPEEPALMELSPPEPGNGDVLVRVDAVDVGLWDAKARRGEAGRDHEFPLILGCEAAGSVERVGPGVSTLRPGNRVFTYAYADLVAAPAKQTALAPERADAAVVAALPICRITAYREGVDAPLECVGGEKLRPQHSGRTPRRPCRRSRRQALDRRGCELSPTMTLSKEARHRGFSSLVRPDTSDPS